MATKDDLITWAKIYELNGESWKQINNYTDTSATFYLASPCFVIELRVETVLFRSNWVNLTASYYNGSSWVQAYAPRNDEGYTIYGRGGTKKGIKLYHNRPQEGTTSGDQKNYHLWKIDIQMRGADGSAHGKANIYVSGMELWTQALFNSVVSTDACKYIKWCQPSITKGGDATQWLSTHRPSAKRGTAISISSGTANQLVATAID